jgi:hypothetical protein
LKSAANCSISNFIRADALQYPTAIKWIKAANKAEWKYDPDARPGIWVSLFWFQQGFRPSHETNIAKRFPTFFELRQVSDHTPGVKAWDWHESGALFATRAQEGGKKKMGRRW